MQTYAKFLIGEKCMVRLGSGGGAAPLAHNIAHTNCTTTFIPIGLTPLWPSISIPPLPCCLYDASPCPRR